MSALPQALPLAISAAVYPPALVVLLLMLSADHPRGLVFAYFCGALLVTVTAGLITLALLKGAGLTTQSSKSASGSVYIVVGVLLLVLAGLAWRRRARPSVAQPEASDAGSGRVARLTQHALSSHKWAFALGLAMFLPSPLYILAVKEIADSGGPASSDVLAVLICAAGVLLFVEIPLIALFFRPDRVADTITRFDGWLKRNGWTLAAILALIGGVYSIVKGITLLG